jgi:hypothetical protein
LSTPNLSPFLREHGLFFGDWVRLLEGWAERLVSDGELRAAAAVVLAEQEPRSLTAVNPDPRVWPACDGEARTVVDGGGDAVEGAVSWGLAGLREGARAALRGVALKDTVAGPSEDTREDSLPFRRGGAPEAPRSSFGRAPQVPPAAFAASAPISTEITTAPVLEIVQRGAALPFRRPVETDGSGPAPARCEPPAMTLEQYASLCAELAVSPHQVEAIFDRHGLKDLKERLRVDLWWQTRLRRDPAEHQQWQALYQRFHAYWVAETRRRETR